MPTPADRLTAALIWALALLAALFLVWPVWRAFLPLEIWGNEGWNAYHADTAMRGGSLYPPPDGLVANNYPPLSFYIVGALAQRCSAMRSMSGARCRSSRRSASASRPRWWCGSSAAAARRR